MGRVNSRIRSIRIKIKQKRREKLDKFRQLYLKTGNEGEKERIFSKALKISPWLKKEEFISLGNKKNDQSN